MCGDKHIYSRWNKIKEKEREKRKIGSHVSLLCPGQIVKSVLCGSVSVLPAFIFADLSWPFACSLDSGFPPAPDWFDCLCWTAFWFWPLPAALSPWVLLFFSLCYRRSLNHIRSASEVCIWAFPCYSTCTSCTYLLPRFLQQGDDFSFQIPWRKMRKLLPASSKIWHSVGIFWYCTSETRLKEMYRRRPALSDELPHLALYTVSQRDRLAAP